MRIQSFAAIGYLLIAILLGACASPPVVMAPDTRAGDQLLDKYIPGKWCTNREETAQRNKDAGFSALTNVSKQFWRFGSKGEWGTSISGWLFEHHGSWRLQGLDTLLLSKTGAEPTRYQARFINDGADLSLQRDSGEFLVMSRCD
jgi:hypothetical protein